jgi:Family of unknown function (DUF5681)
MEAMSNFAPAITGPKQDGRFKEGQSGNPAGRPVGSRHKATLAAEALPDGEAEGLSRKAVELAFKGDTVALRLCLERIIPARKDRPVSFSLPQIQTAADTVKASAALLNAVAAGELTPSEAAELGKLVAAHVQAIQAVELEARITRLEGKGS